MKLFFIEVFGLAILGNYQKPEVSIKDSFFYCLKNINMDKEEQAAYDAQYQKDNKDRIRETKRLWYKNNKDKRNEAQRLWYKNNQDKVKEYRLKACLNHPEKTSARSAISNAVKLNKIPHVSTLSCKDCGNQAQNYHHEDYDKPLKVTPLCAYCHCSRHSAP